MPSAAWISASVSFLVCSVFASECINIGFVYTSGGSVKVSCVILPEDAVEGSVEVWVTGAHPASRKQIPAYV